MIEKRYALQLIKLQDRNMQSFLKVSGKVSSAVKENVQGTARKKNWKYIKEKGFWGYMKPGLMRS